MAYFLKILNVLILSTVKYFYTPIYAHMIGLDIWSTAITMIIGGVIGFLFYYHISKIMLLSAKHMEPVVNVLIPAQFRNKINKYKQRRKLKRKNKKIFTKRNRRLVKLGQNYGMYTLIFFTPILVSLVLGAFLLRRYYGNRRDAVPLMIVAIIVEGALLVVGYWYIMGEL